MQYFREALDLLNPGEKRQIVYLLGLSALAAFAQTIAIVSIMPFIILLSNPAALDTNAALLRLNELVSAESSHGFLVLLGVAGISALALGNVFVALENWLIQRYLSLLGHRLEKDLMRTILNRPFEYFSEHHSGRLSNIVLDQVERVVDGVIGTFFGVVSNAVLTAFVVLMLLFVSFESTLITLGSLFALYSCVFLFLKSRIASHGEDLTQLSGDIHTAVKESFDGIREIKMYRAEGFVARRFERSSRPLADLAVRSGVLSFVPNFVLETLVFSGLVGVGLYFVVVANDSSMSLTFIALYGMATYRLVPALNGVFEGLAEMQHSCDAVRVVREHFVNPVKDEPQRELHAVSRSIRFRNVSYRYPQENVDQLKDIDLEIPAGSSICLFGESGAGKSTLLNMLAGLIRPRSGDVLCDDTSLSTYPLQSWRAKVGLCPQQIYLFDGTIASNIAFGTDEDNVDLARVAQVGTLAQLDRVVAGREAGYLSRVGEGGSALSGGQRQRVGIARALYNDAPVIVLDEALVGLDEVNQSSILDSLFDLPGKTLIIATHDIAVARRCDQVALLDGGRVVAKGTPDQVLNGEYPAAKPN